MEKENYEFLKMEYDKQIAAFKVELDKKYVQKKGQGDLRTGANEVETQKNFELSARTHGVTKKDELAVKEANNYKAHTQNWLFEQEKQQELSKIEKALEKQIWKDHGGSRIAAKEKAFGLDDPEVKAHHERLQRNQEQQKALEQARNQENRGQLSKEFNREQARQNLREQFQEKGGRTM